MCTDHYLDRGCLSCLSTRLTCTTATATLFAMTILLWAGTIEIDFPFRGHLLLTGHYSSAWGDKFFPCRVAIALVCSLDKSFLPLCPLTHKLAATVAAVLLLTSYQFGHSPMANYGDRHRLAPHSRKFIGNEQKMSEYFLRISVKEN